MRIAKEFSDGTKLGWDKGRLDDWCVYWVEPDGKIWPPLDKDYFNDLLTIADKYGHERVYKDFVKMYDAIVSKNPDECHIEVIDSIVSEYPPEDRLFIDKEFTILWMAMVSEWNYMIPTKSGKKIPTKLQHRIKRLGVYTMLVKGKSPEYSAVFMNKMPWQEINELCKEDGFDLKI